MLRGLEKSGPFCIMAVMAYGTGNLARGSLSASGNSGGANAPNFVAGPGLGQGRFNFSTSGTFAATYRLERRFVGAQTWHPATNNGAAVSFTGPVTEVLIEPEPGTEYRVAITSYTSGTLDYRFSQ